MPKFADLHLHTNFSDGTLSPEELVEVSEEAGLSAIAIVDHDIVGGISRAEEKAGDCGLEVISGIELTCAYELQEIHLLGYLFDYKSMPLLTKLESLRQNRIERIHKIIEKLKKLDIELAPESVLGLTQFGSVGRLHVARALLNEGKVSSIYEAFHKYIGDKGPAYVLDFKLSPAEAVKLIKNAGGIPVLAHPYVFEDDEFVVKLIKYGIMGLEVHYPEHSQSTVNFYLELAKKHSLLVTGGSDFHGSAKPNIKVGDIKVPYELVERLKEAKQRL